MEAAHPFQDCQQELAEHILSNRISRKMEYEKSRAEQRGMGMAGTCGIFITAAAEAMANVTFVAAAA